MSEEYKWFISILGFFMIGSALIICVGERERAREHERYIKCVETGEKPIQCSFAAAFKGESK